MLDNAHIAELLSLEAETAREPVLKAFKRAARSAFLWPVEAEEMLRQGRSLTELRSIGPFLAKLIQHWIEEPPKIPEPPLIRRGFLTVPVARQVLASRPRWRTGLQGDLQMHTSWSDGSGSILEMARAAEPRHYDYIAITDHTKGLKIAGGIDEAELNEQGREIEGVNASLQTAGSALRVLRSAEVNLNPRGEVDMAASALATLDIVLGSFHSALRKTDDQTERYLAALRNPAIQILGHPRARFVDNYRLGLAADWPRVFALSAELGKAVEIDAYPDRQDLSVDLAKEAARAGCHVSLGTDAHHPWQLEFIELGIAAAVLAGIRRERILNFKPRPELLIWVREARTRSRRLTPN